MLFGRDRLVFPIGDGANLAITHSFAEELTRYP